MIESLLDCDSWHCTYWIITLMTVMLLCCRLRPLDVSFMKAVHHKVNIVPVIAKSDTLTQQECTQLKRKVSALDTVWARNKRDSENIHFQCIIEHLHLQCCRNFCETIWCCGESFYYRVFLAVLLWFWERAPFRNMHIYIIKLSLINLFISLSNKILQIITVLR